MKITHQINIDPEAVGACPQSEGMISGYNYLAPNSIRKIDYSKKIDFPLNLDSIRMAHRAKWVDIVNSVVINSLCSKIISKRLMDILENFRLPAHQIFDAVLKKGKIVKTYSFFYIYEFGQDYIDYEKSEFFIGRSFGSRIESIEINTQEEYKKAKATTPLPLFVSIDKLVLLKECPYDMIRLYQGATGYYISDRLKNAMEEAGCVGIRYIPIEDVSDDPERASELRKARLLLEQEGRC